MTFESNSGSAVAPQSVTCGEAATEPDAPERLGYTFDGWFSDEALAKAYDFAATHVTADITLYAKWEIDEYTVAFDADGGSVVAPQTVAHGDKASKPADPTKVGHAFQGWYSDEGCTQAYDFGSAVTSDLTLRAKWQINKYMVAFDAGDGSEVASQTVDYGHAASKPADPVWVGHTFQGWFSDKALTKAYDFDAAVTSDIALYAKWEINEYTVAFDSRAAPGSPPRPSPTARRPSSPTTPPSSATRSGAGSPTGTWSRHTTSARPSWPV